VTEALTVVLLGFFLGMRHATDPDHVIAVTTIVSRQRTIRAAAAIGILWGIGHTITMVGVGGTIILLGLVVPPRLGLSLELAVALMLIVLGVLALTGLRPGAHATRAGVVHAHAHRHDDYVHTHPHQHDPGRHGHDEHRTPQARLDRWLGGLRLYQAVRPLVVGVVHGLAGSAAVALLVLATIRSPLWAIAYLLVFGFGTIAGMMMITAAVAWPITYAAGRVAGMDRALAVGAGILSVAFGLFLVYQIGFVDGLFGPIPRWTPE
jgi:hypothetical protein